MLGVEQMTRTRKTMMRKTSTGVTTMAKRSPIQLPDLLKRMLHDHVPNLIHREATLFANDQFSLVMGMYFDHTPHQSLLEVSMSLISNLFGAVVQ
jgi:hypothetical protein